MPQHIRHILMVQRGKFEKVLYEKRAKIQRKWEGGARGGGGVKTRCRFTLVQKSKK